MKKNITKWKKMMFFVCKNNKKKCYIELWNKKVIRISLIAFILWNYLWSSFCNRIKVAMVCDGTPISTFYCAGILKFDSLLLITTTKKKKKLLNQKMVQGQSSVGDNNSIVCSIVFRDSFGRFRNGASYWKNCWKSFRILVEFLVFSIFAET